MNFVISQACITLCNCTILYVNIGITVGLNTAHSVNENQGNIEICIDIIVGALERNISVHLQTVPITGRECT